MAFTKSLIVNTLERIVREVNRYVTDSDTKPVELLNIAQVSDKDSSATAANFVVMSIVNLQEERLLRNAENVVRRNERAFYRNPGQHFILTLLFAACNQENTSQRYTDAIFLLEGVIRFFQQKAVFNRDNTPELEPEIEKIIFELVNMNQEQTHQLWSSLGGRYLPSVLYHMRLITIQENREHDDSLLIKEIQQRPPKQLIS